MINFHNDSTSHLYYLMQLIRRTEQAIAEIYPSDKIKSPVHLAVGHEASTAGVCAALEPADVVFGYYRSHGLYLAKGGNIKTMMAELYGKQNGCAQGWGGSMHLLDLGMGVMSTSAIVASSVPNAVGYAYALKQQKSRQIVVSFLGDGATEEGVVSESLNFAALKRLPILFVCENNRLAIHTKQHQRQALPDIAGRAQALGVTSTVIQGNDAEAVYESVSKSVNEIRSGDTGPQFYEILTSRWLEHVGPGEDFHLGYRERTEVSGWQDQDCLNQLAQKISAQQKTQIDQQIDQQIQEAIEYAEQGDFPQAGELNKYVYR